MICFHEWRFTGVDLEPAVCVRCRRQGNQWYDLLSGGVSLLRGRLPSVDLRDVYRACEYQ